MYSNEYTNVHTHDNRWSTQMINQKWRKKWPGMNKLQQINKYNCPNTREHEEVSERMTSVSPSITNDESKELKKNQTNKSNCSNMC